MDETKCILNDLFYDWGMSGGHPTPRFTAVVDFVNRIIFSLAIDELIWRLNSGIL